MFVDVELPVQLPARLTVPSDAVVDTGLRRTVYIDRGNGSFEPRRVETGVRFDDRIEITKGLTEGERVVASGSFLVDSESRIRLAAAGLPEDYALDPVCGMGVDPRKAGEKKSIYHGQTYYFCMPECKTRFEAEPQKYVRKEAEAGMKVAERRAHDPEQSADSRPTVTAAKDPVCGMEVDTSAPGALKADYLGKTYYFCNPSCKESFLNNPAKYLAK
jgi:YHS domain-containing protein